jgi:hypothetical protein
MMKLLPLLAKKQLKTDRGHGSHDLIGLGELKKEKGS